MYYVAVLRGLLILWEKGNQSIVYGDDGNRIHVENTDNGSSIVIREAEEDDAGVYVCKVSAAELTHTVEILGKAGVYLTPKQKSPSFSHLQ